MCDEQWMRSSGVNGVKVKRNLIRDESRYGLYAQALTSKKYVSSEAVLGSAALCSGGLHGG